MSAALPSLVIEPAADGYLIVRVGDRWTELGRDEALWVVAHYLQGNVHQWLKTDEQHAARRSAYGPPDAAAASLLGQIAGASVAVDRPKGGA